MSEFLTAALSYASRGWPVFPLVPKAKIPLLSKRHGGNGFLDATTDKEQITAWWQRAPNANVGLRAGIAFDVLDIDGEVGAESIAKALEELDEALPEGPTSRTGSGGSHRLFQPCGGNRAGLLPKVDWRGDGGYIVAPPSVHPSGGIYEWVEGPGAPLPEVPDWLLPLVVKVKPDQQPVGTIKPLPANVGDGTPYGLQALQAELDDLSRQTEGNRNHAVNATSFSLHQLVAGGELNGRAVAERITAVALAIGLPDHEVRTAVGSGREDGLRQPRNAPAFKFLRGGAYNGKAPLNGAAPKSEEKRGGSQATRLVAMADERYEFGRATTGEPFAVPRKGAYVARLLRGGRDSLRAELANIFVEEMDKAPSSSALADAMLVLEGKAQKAEPQVTALRVARMNTETVVLDLGDVTGRVVMVTPDGWDIVDRSPVLFRRSELTGTLPVPTRGGSLESLRQLVNITEASWPLMVSWLVAALLEDIPHPILMPIGEQGSGKTTAARLLVQTVDPSPAPVRSSPKDDEAWAVAAAGSHLVALDNISTIAPWLSDALCRAVTGDGLIRRRLYSDSDLTVISIRRVILLTSIDPGALRGDLADRLLPVELEQLGPTQRREDEALAREFVGLRPAILGALLDVLAEVLAVLPGIQLEQMPRMADFAKVAAAVDATQSMESLAAYNTLGKRLAAEVVESDYVGKAVRALMVGRDTPWTGSASDLLEAIRPEHPPKGFPSDGARLSGKLKRVAPALRLLGIDVDWSRDAGRRTGGGGRVIRITTPRTGRGFSSSGEELPW